MAFKTALRSVGFDDEEKYDLAKKATLGADYEPPDYPSGLCFCISCGDLEKAEAVGGDPGDTMAFSAMGAVTNTYHDVDDCRIELELTEFAGDDGKFFELSMPAHICLTRAELEKIDLSSDAERDDTLHLIGTARLESKSSSEYGGEMCRLQITELNCEDESEESREG